MGFNFRKSLKIAPGVKLNITKQGISSLSVGGKGARVNLGKKGTKTTLSIPKTGLSHTSYTPYSKGNRSSKDKNSFYTASREKNQNISLWIWIGLITFFLFIWIF